jgi:hypothetical protein
MRWVYCVTFILLKTQSSCPVLFSHYLIKPFNFTEIQFSYNSEGIKLEDKDLMQDVQTKFVPPAVTYYTIRQKRSTAYADEAHTLQTYRVRPRMAENIMLTNSHSCYNSCNLKCLLYKIQELKKK